MFNLNSELTNATTLLNQGNFDGARKIVSRVLKIAPKNVSALYLMGGVCKLEGDLLGAEKFYKKSLSLVREQPHVENSIGALYLKKKQFQNAIGHLKRAVKLHSNYLEAWNNLGIAYLNIKDYSAAWQSYEQASKLKPNFQPAIRGQARCLIGQNAFDRAIHLLQKAILLAPNQSENYFYLGRCFLNLGRFDEAESQLNIALKISPNSTPILHEAAKVAMLMGNNQDAEKYFSQALKASPNNLELLKDYSRFLFFSGKQDQFLGPIMQALEAGEGNGELVSTLAQNAIRIGQFELAREQLEKFENLHGSSSLVSTMLSYLNSEEDKPEEAFLWAKQAVSLAPESKSANQQLGIGAMLTQHYDAAIKATKKACKLEPADQLSVAYHFTAQRLAGDSLADGLYDLKRLVGEVFIETPDEFNSLVDFNSHIKSELLGLHELAGEPIDQSLRGGTQVQLTQLMRSSRLLSLLGTQLLQAIGTFSDQIEVEDGHPFLGRRPDNLDFSGIWSVRLTDGGNHVSHVHPEGWLSACYYVDLPEDAMNDHQHQGWLRLGAPPYPRLAAKLDHLDVRPEVGKIIIFPSYLWHGTLPFSSTNPRLTVAFDIPTNVPAKANF